MQVRIFLFVVVCVLGQSPGQKMYAFAAANPDSTHRPYTLNYKIDIPITAVTIFGNFYGLKLLKRNFGIDDPDEIYNLDPGNVPKFDRSALSLNSSFFAEAHDISDIGLNVSTVLPVLLFLDKDMRADWLQLTFLYLESQFVFANVYIWGGPHASKRYRPFVYYSEIPIQERRGDFRKNSFFSGHASFTGVASFFMASTYSMYHKDVSKLLLYSLATVPPVFVSYFRYRAGKHFPSDVIVGTVIGAIGGIIVPYLHRSNKKRPDKSWTFNPILGETKGLRLSYHL